MDRGKGKVDSRLKKINKNRGGHVQSATVGDLNALFGLILELAREMGEDQEIPELTDQPLPFLQTVEIQGADYRIHLEMKKDTIKTLVQAAMDMEE